MHLAAAVKVRSSCYRNADFLQTEPSLQQPFFMIRNPEVAGRNLQYYLYDGRDIRGTNEELRRCMASITFDSVYQTLRTECPFLQGSR